MAPKAHEGLRLARLMMVLSGLSPLFLLWAVRGIPGIKDAYLWVACSGLIALPNAVLYLRIAVAQSQGDISTLTIGQAEDHREHLLVYLFAILLPLYDLNFGEERQFWAAIMAVSIIVFLFFHLDLHYMNFMFALLGYRVFTVHPAASNEDTLSRADKFVLLTFRPYLRPEQEIRAVRISNSVYFEPRPLS